MRKRKRSILLAFAFIAPILSACEPHQDTSGIALRTAAEECRRQIEVGLLPELIRSCDGLDVFITGGTLNNDFPLAINEQYAEKRTDDKTSSKTVAVAGQPSQNSTTNPIFVWIYSGSSPAPISYTPNQPAYTRSAITATRATYSRPYTSSFSGPRTTSSNPTMNTRAGFGRTATSMSSSSGS